MMLKWKSTDDMNIHKISGKKRKDEVKQKGMLSKELKGEDGLGQG